MPDEVDQSRFWGRVDKEDPSGCWIWTGYINNRGYGSMAYQGATRLAHRIAWTLTHGPIPEGLQIDHLCRTRRCVNPAHFELVTHGENIHRGYQAKNQTHCKRGHDLALAFVHKDGRRDCMLCRPERKKEKANAC